MFNVLLTVHRDISVQYIPTGGTIYFQFSSVFNIYMFRAGLLPIIRRQRLVEMWWHMRKTIFRLSAKRTSPFKSARASVQSTTGSRGVRISGSNAGYTMFRGSVKGTGYPLHSSVSTSLPLPCVTVCHHISAGVYYSVCASCCIYRVIPPDDEQ